MCDYSLAVFPNRLAVEGERLVVHQFRTGSKGLAAFVDLQPAEPPLQPFEPCVRNTLWQRFKSIFEEPYCPNISAVCVPPGARLLLKNVPEDLQRRWNVKEEESVSFVEISAMENTYRDAVQFGDGRQVILQDLREGMLLRVLSLGGVETGDEQESLVRSA